jgi:hypothetical protein
MGPTASSLPEPLFNILSRRLKFFSKTFLLEKDKKGYILTGLTQIEKPGVCGFDLKYGFFGYRGLTKRGFDEKNFTGLNDNSVWCCYGFL